MPCTGRHDRDAARRPAELPDTCTSLPRPVSLIEAIVLGIVQGLTEFLPISSSAHQRIVPALLGWEDPGAAFTAVTQLGTETAVLIYFRHELWAVATTWLRSLRDARLRSHPDARLGWYLIVATIPIGIFGLAFEQQIETGARNLWLIGSTLVVFALVLGYADRRGRHERTIDALSTRDGVLIGLAQSLALIPGVSRSGATMSAGLLLGLQRPAAAKFGFLLAVPAVVISGVFQLQGIISGEEGGDEPFGYVALATAISFVVGYAAIAWFLRYLAHHSVRLFVIYRILLGATVLMLVAAGTIS
jgi:undecaprenyl-diphosphatase